jgi:hypothetical protein
MPTRSSLTQSLRGLLMSRHSTHCHQPSPKWYGLVNKMLNNYNILLCLELITIVTVFSWIKGYANFQLTAPVHKKRVLMRRIKWYRPRIVKHWEFYVIWILTYLSTILYSKNYWRDTSIVFNLEIYTTLSRKLLTTKPDTKIGQTIVINSRRRSSPQYFFKGP